METQPVTFTTLGNLKAHEKFVVDVDDITEPAEHLMFLSFSYDGAAMISAANTHFVRGFKSGLDKNTPVVKLSH